MEVNSWYNIQWQESSVWADRPHQNPLVSLSSPPTQDSNWQVHLREPPFFLPLISLPFPHYNGSVIFKVCTWWPSQHNNKPSSPPNKGCQSLIPPVPDCQIIIHASHILTWTYMIMSLHDILQKERVSQQHSRVNLEKFVLVKICMQQEFLRQ